MHGKRKCQILEMIHGTKYTTTTNQSNISGTTTKYRTTVTDQNISHVNTGIITTTNQRSNLMKIEDESWESTEKSSDTLQKNLEYQNHRDQKFQTHYCHQ